MLVRSEALLTRTGRDGGGLEANKEPIAKLSHVLEREKEEEDE